MKPDRSRGNDQRHQVAHVGPHPAAAIPPNTRPAPHLMPPPGPTPGSVITARWLSKWYGQIIGLNNFNVEIGPGITGLVGPNGAGKSTFFKLLTGLVRPSAGDVFVLGGRPWSNPVLSRRIGLCPDYDNLPHEMTGRAFLQYTGQLHGMTGAHLEGRIRKVSNIVHMEEYVDRRIGGYSKGMKQRIKIAGAMIHEPELLLLDEPLSGTDPIGRRMLIDLVRELHEEHRHNVIVSSHVLHEIERLTHRVVVIYRGRAVASGDISDIRKLIDQRPHNILMEVAGPPSPADAPKEVPPVVKEKVKLLAKAVLDMKGVVTVHLNPDGRSMYVQVTDPDLFFNDIPVLLLANDIEVSRMHSLDDNLESVFKYLVGVR